MSWAAASTLIADGVSEVALVDAIRARSVRAYKTPYPNAGGYLVAVDGDFRAWKRSQPRPRKERAKSAPAVIYPEGTIGNAEAKRLTSRNPQSLCEAGVKYELIQDVNGKGRYRAWSLASITEYIARRDRGERRAPKDPEGRLTIGEAAALAGVSEHVLRRADDVLTPERVGNRRRYRREVVLQWAASRRSS